MIERYHNSLIKLFSKVQQLNASRGRDRALARETQESLIRKISYVERRIRARKAAIDQSRYLLKGGAPERLTREQARELKERIVQLQRVVDEYQEIHLIFRQIGDAIAFTYLDKYDVKPLAFKQSPGFISGKKGSRLERKILREAFNKGGSSILNDLTTCLRYGDVTLPLGGPFVIFEAKSGRRRTARDHCQKEANEKVMNYIYSDKVDGLYGQNALFIRCELSVPERNHVRALNRVISEATNKGTASRKVEDGVYYYASYVSDESKRLMGIIRSCKEIPFVCFVNLMKRGNLAHYPFTLSISDPERLYDFYVGSLMLIVIVDPHVFKRRFSDLGFKVTVSNNEGYPIVISSPKIPFDKNEVLVGQHFWERIFCEFLSLQWFADEISQRLGRIDKAFIGQLESQPPIAPEIEQRRRISGSMGSTLHR